MRKPIANNATAEEKRERDAIKEACYCLGRLALDVTSWTDRGANTHDPKQERGHAIAAVKLAVKTLPETPDNLPAITLLRNAIPALERLQAKNPRGRSADLWSERNQLIVETRKLICQKYGFTQERGNSIISQALAELEGHLGWFEKFGVKKPKIALSETRIKAICSTRK
jgi:hypothetical protein